MDSEDELWRPKPSRPYESTTARLQVPQAALDGTSRLLQRAGRRESGVFWYGSKDSDGGGTVKYIVAPPQRMAPRNYHVSAGALTDIVSRLPNDWKALAQVHSHPGIRVEHSCYDDRMASSRRALSLVFPLYGRATDPFPAGIGVHEFQIDYWHLLDEETAAKRILVCDGHVKIEDQR